MNDAYDSRGPLGRPGTASPQATPAVDPSAPLTVQFEALERAYQGLLDEMRTRTEEEDRQALAMKQAQLGLRATERELLRTMVAEQFRVVSFLGAAYMALLHSKRWRAGDRLLRVVEILLRKPKQSRSPGRLRAALDRLAKWEAQFHAASDEHLPDSALFAALFGDGNADATTQATQIDTVAARLRSEHHGLRRAWDSLAQLQEEIAYYGAQVQRSWRWRIGATIGGVLARSSPQSSSGHSLESIPVLEAYWKGNQKLLNQMLPFLHDVDGAICGDQREKRSPRLSVDRSRVRVTQFTPPNPGNPYYTLLPQQLRARGWTIQYSTDRAQVLQQTQSGHFNTEIVHFHQLEPFYHAKSEGLDETTKNAESLVAFLKALQESGARLVWTKHNPLPHDRRFSDIDAFVESAALDLFDEVIVLGEHARQILREQAPEKPITRVLHPAFQEAYGPLVEKENARTVLGLSNDSFIFGNIGELRPYKGLELILDAFERLLQQTPEPKPLLVLAGRAPLPDYLKELERRASANVLVRGEEISDDAIPRWLGALDAAVFAFRDIWMSSSVMLALSYGVPPVAPRLGCLPEYVRNDDTGFLYQHDDVQALCDRMADALHSPLLAHMRYQCSVHVKDDWSVDHAATALERVYERLIHTQHP